MKQRFTLYRRSNGMFYCEDTHTRKQQSLKTKDENEAHTLLHCKNEAFRQPILNQQIALTYLSAADGDSTKRTWQDVMVLMAQSKKKSTLVRWQSAMKDSAFDLIRNVGLFETRPEQFFAVLKIGTVSTNVFLRRIQNFALDMNWLPRPVIPRRQWPAITFKEKRGITAEEHEAIFAGERDAEWRAFYELLWNIGGAQSDVAQLRAEDIDWSLQVISFERMKTGSVVQLHFGGHVAALMRSPPARGQLLPRIAAMKESDRAKAFMRRCRLVKVSGVSLHSYRYSWAERAKVCGYPERFAQQALGHGSKAVHRAYAKKAQMKLPSLEDYERKIIPLQPSPAPVHDIPLRATA